MALYFTQHGNGPTKQLPQNSTGPYEDPARAARMRSSFALVAAVLLVHEALELVELLQGPAEGGHHHLGGEPGRGRRRVARRLEGGDPPLDNAASGCPLRGHPRGSGGQ